MTPQSFDIFLPRQRDTATVFASPHSGRDYPEAFILQSPLTRRQLRSSEDAYVDLLYDAATREGAPLIAARAPRAYVDLNRAAEELDPSLIEGMRRGSLNPRVASGLGVIPRVVAASKVIHPGRISREEAEMRLDSVWHPYHAALRGLLADSQRQFGAAILIDLHSMPHEALAAGAPSDHSLPHVVLGDRYGSSCGSAIMAKVEAAFQAAGFRTARNAPFAGAYIAQTYGRPSAGQHVVQVEIDRSLYMDEARILPLPEFDALRARLAGVVATLCEIGRGISASALAAE